MKKNLNFLQAMNCPRWQTENSLWFCSRLELVRTNPMCLRSSHFKEQTQIFLSHFKMLKQEWDFLSCFKMAKSCECLFVQLDQPVLSFKQSRTTLLWTKTRLNGHKNIFAWPQLPSLTDVCLIMKHLDWIIIW